MAQIVSGMIVASSTTDIPVGKSLLVVTVHTYDMGNLNGITVSAVATGSTFTASTGVDGRAEVLVNSGKTYIVSLTHSGSYAGDEPQKVAAADRETYWLDFDLRIDAYIYENVSAAVWVADTTCAGYGYACSIALTGVTSSDWPCVTFGFAEASSGNYAPICATYDGGVKIYSKVNTGITVKTILIHKRG